MGTQLIDSHAHLDFDSFDHDRPAVLERAQAAGVSTVISIGTTIESSTHAAALANQHSMVFSTAGIHPHQVDAFVDEDWHHLETLWASPKVVGVGETGLDYFYDVSCRTRQKALFKKHLKAAERLDYPCIIHVRDAFDDAFSLIENVGVGQRGIIHCFTGGKDECQRALDLGLYISLSGIVTFKNARGLRESVSMIPDDRILVETDAPFLAPVPHRGKRNEPSFVEKTARVVAELRGQSFEDLAYITTRNTERVFSLPTD
ncbi:MAG: hypothetical protein CMH52_13060 [Myxococcales bacterium]|nr:hypothetical protein [Myxococcales bacterium]